MHRKFAGGLATLTTAAVVALGVTGAADGATAPSKTTIKVTAGVKIKPNRWIQDSLRWDKDVYRVKSGGTLRIVNTAADEGPHTFTVVKRTDLPRAGAFRGCPICDKLGAAHGADPNSDAPPKFPFLENGVGQSTPPDVDRPGDSGVTGEGKKGESITLKVTAKKNTQLYFMCLIHPWMEAKVLVG
jgi:plastocyanin